MQPLRRLAASDSLAAKGKELVAAGPAQAATGEAESIDVAARGQE